MCTGHTVLTVDNVESGAVTAALTIILPSCSIVALSHALPF